MGRNVIDYGYQYTPGPRNTDPNPSLPPLITQNEARRVGERNEVTSMKNPKGSPEKQEEGAGDPLPEVTELRPPQRAPGWGRGTGATTEVGPRWAGATVRWLPAWSVGEVLSGKKRDGKMSWLSGPGSGLSLAGSGFCVGWRPHPGRDRAVKGPGLWGGERR